MVARDRLLQAIEQVESGGRRDAVSPKGARGRMQVMPATARQPGYRVKPARDESEEEYTRVGRDYAMALLNHYGGDLEATLVAYNYGPGNANKWIASGRKKSDLPEETRNYITRVGKQLGGDKMARRPLEFVKQDKLSELTKKAAKNPDSAEARKVVRELIARGLPVPKKLQKTIGKARAEAGVGSPPREVPRPERKPRVPKQERDKRERTDLGPMSEADRRNALVEAVRSMSPPGRNRTEAEFAASPQRQRPVQMRPPSDFERTYVRKGSGVPPLQRRAEDIALPFNRVTGYRGNVRPTAPPPPPERQLRRGVSRVPTGDFGVGSGLTDRAEDIALPFNRVTGYRGNVRPTAPPRAMPDSQRGSDLPLSPDAMPGPGMGYDPNLDPTTGISIDDDVIQERDMPDSLRGSEFPLTDNEGRDYETLREYFIENLAPRKSNVKTPFGIIEIDSTEEGMFPDFDMYNEKKGGRLKKKKRVARKKKAAPKKKKTVAKKKPVVRKKAVAKKPLVRKKAVAKKPAGRKRAAKRGFGAELRGN